MNPFLKSAFSIAVPLLLNLPVALAGSYQEDCYEAVKPFVHSERMERWFWQSCDKIRNRQALRCVQAVANAVAEMDTWEIEDCGEVSTNPALWSVKLILEKVRVNRTGYIATGLIQFVAPYRNDEHYYCFERLVESEESFSIGQIKACGKVK